MGQLNEPCVFLDCNLVYLRPLAERHQQKSNKFAVLFADPYFIITNIRPTLTQLFTSDSGLIRSIRDEPQCVAFYFAQMLYVF